MSSNQGGLEGRKIQGISDMLDLVQICCEVRVVHSKFVECPRTSYEVRLVCSFDSNKLITTPSSSFLSLVSFVSLQKLCNILALKHIYKVGSVIHSLSSYFIALLSCWHPIHPMRLALLLMIQLPNIHLSCLHLFTIVNTNPHQ